MRLPCTKIDEPGGKKNGLLAHPRDYFGHSTGHERCPEKSTFVESSHRIAILSRPSLKPLAFHHVWATAQLLQWLGMIVTIVTIVHSVKFFRKSKKIKLHEAIAPVTSQESQVTSQKSVDEEQAKICFCTRPFIQWAIVIVIAGAFVVCSNIWQAGNQWCDPLSFAGAAHGAFFEEVFKGQYKKPSMLHAVVFSDFLAAIFALITLGSVLLLLNWSDSAERDKLTLSEHEDFTNRLSDAKELIELIATMASVTLAICIFQMNALARLPLGLIQCNDCATVVKLQADGATFAAATAFTVLMAAFFGSALMVIHHREKRIKKLDAYWARHFTAWADEPTKGLDSIGSLPIFLKLILPLLAALITSFIGTSLKL